MALRDQDRARFALGKVEPLASRPAKERSKLKTQLLKLPARLHTNGLGPTVAFYLSAGPGKPEVEICSWLEEWLHQVPVYRGTTLIRGVSGTGMTPAAAEASYRLASGEARALAVWLKRFAEAFVEGDPG